jgi:tRNA uridine 5-carbamoylmethylation protein Kti12
LFHEFSGRIAESQASSARPKTILYIPSQHSLSDSGPDSLVSLRDQIYNSVAAEKNARAAEFSNTKRSLTKDTVIIADSLNYIKGYRYQLWCEAKAAGTRCCVVHVAAREDECKKWNRERLRQCGDGAEDEDGETMPGIVTGEEQDAKRPAGFGELVPESHTALYGDREDFEPRSRSSSTDVQLENGPPTPSLTSLSLRDANSEAPPSLASLSLNDNYKNEFDPTSNKHVRNGADTDTSRPPTNPELPHPPPTFPTSLPYRPSTIQSLILRYEPPSPFSRWDTLLFTLPSTDPHPPYDAIWSALFPSAAPSRKLAARNGPLNTPAGDTDAREATADEVRPHAATVLPPFTSAQALQLLERTTAEIVTSLLTAYKAQNIGDEGGDLTINLPSSTDGSGSNTELSLSISIPPATILTQPMLQRLRRKFTQMQRGGIAHGRGHAVERGRRGVVEAFARFLEGEFES